MSGEGKNEFSFKTPIFPALFHASAQMKNTEEKSRLKSKN